MNWDIETYLEYGQAANHVLDYFMFEADWLWADAHVAECWNYRIDWELDYSAIDKRADEWLLDSMYC
jgi:hypothetical protein